jgi:ATP-dependent helicase HrpA
MPDLARSSLMEALLKAVRERTQLAVQRNDFKLEQLPPHLFMNFRVLDEHGRQLAQGRDLARLKAELGAGAQCLPGAGRVEAGAPCTRGCSPVPAPAAKGVRAIIEPQPPPCGLQPGAARIPHGPLANCPS